MKFIVYKDKKGEWRWKLRAANGKIIADSGEGYKRRKDCYTMASRLQDRMNWMQGHRAYVGIEAQE